MTFWPVDVAYDVHRTVYVDAPTELVARQRALDPSNWADAEQPHERMDTLRLVAVDGDGGNGDSQEHHA